MSAIRWTIDSPVGAEITIDGKRYVNFGGSSYLGLSGNASVLDAGVEALKRYGAGIPAARDQGLASRGHQHFEDEASQFFATETAVYLSSGYFFGLMALPALRDRFDVIFHDELAHYSLREAIAASRCRCHVFPHLDANALRAILQRNLRPGERPLIATDGVFPTFGEIAPLARLSELAKVYEGVLLVDESHSFGVLGKSGRGAAEYEGLPSSSAIIGGSLGKAFGAYGGVIPCNADLASVLRATPAGRGASGGLPACARMCATSLRYAREHPELRKRLQFNVSYLKRALRGIGLQMNDSPVPIATFTMTSHDRMQALQSRLMEEGIFVYHSTYIGGGVEGVIRCGIFADHTIEQMDRFGDALRRLV